MAQLQQQASLNSISDGLQSLWKQSTYVAAACHVIARDSKVNADEALLTGLLHAIGSMYVLVRSAAHPVLLANQQELTALRLEWNAPIAQSILENWSFPDSIVQAVGAQEDLQRSHRSGADLTDVLICAKTLTDCDLKRSCVEEKYLLVPAFAKVGLTVDRCLNVLSHSRLHIATMREALSA